MATINSVGAVTLCTVVLLLVACTCVARSSVIKVSQLECPQCTNINNALQEITSDTTLFLLSGADHVLDQFTIVRNLRNVTLIGNDSSVTVTCSEDIGLAFINITNLTIKHVTIQQCGLSKENLWNAIYVTAEIVNMFFHVPFPLHVGLLLGDITHANLGNVKVCNTTGIGLLGINVVGTGSFTEVTFLHNVYSGKNCSVILEPEVLRGVYKNQIGGGAFLLYHDYLNHSSVYVNLTVQSSTFIENRDCSITGSIARRIPFSETLRKLGYTVGAGGGLSVVLAQREYSANVTIDSCLFDSNLAPYGGGAHVALFADIGKSKIVFSNCNFSGNGLINLTDGGGIAVLGNLVRLSKFSSVCCQASEEAQVLHTATVNIKVNFSNFKSNIAYAGGGIYSLFLQSSKDKSGERIRLHYNNCVFENNIAAYGSALYSYQHNILTASAYSTPPGIRVEATNILARRNILVDRIRNSASSSGTIDIRFTHFTLSGNSTLEHNFGTALRGRRSPIHLVGCTIIQNNIGAFGGAFSLLAFSVLIIHSNTSVILQNNYATYRGGAFYVDFNDVPLFIPNDCFLYLNSSDRYYFDQNNNADIHSLDISLIFSGNHAPYGDLVYGSALKTCSWGDFLKKRYQSYTENFWELLATSKETNDTFQFNNIPAGVEYVTTRTANLNIDGKRNFTAVPGKQFHVTMNATDHLNQVVPIPVTSAVLPNNTTGAHDIHTLVFSVIGDSNYWTLGTNESYNVPLRVFGNQEDHVTVIIFTSDSGADTEIEVYFTECLPGFYYLAGESACVCISQLEENGINCSNTTQELTVPNDVWVGLLNDSTGKQYLAIEQCILDYCEPGTRVIDDYFDIQCTEGYNRTGLLCGSCREGYSVVLGTRRCKECTNNAYLALILVFAVAGILLIALVAFLKVSVSEGYLYGLIFFSHNISPYIFILAPRAPYVFVPVAFLNLDLGIETCFYEGMNALAYTGFRFVFPVYIYLLMVVIVVLARYIKCPLNIGFSTGQTFATLLALTYSSIGQTCVEVLLHQVIHSVEGSVSSIRWSVDPNVHYFQGWHALLVIISIVLFLVYLIPLPLMLLFPTKAYKIKKVKPLLDAFYNPFEPKFRCWVGIGILTGIVLSVIPLCLRLVPAVFTMAMLLSLFAYIQMQLRPYKGFWRNASNNFLVVNTNVLLVGIVFFNGQCRGLHCNANDILLNRTIFSAAILSITYVVFTGVLVYHIFLRLPLSSQKYIKSYIEQNKLVKKIAHFFTEHSVLTQDNIELIDEHAYYRFTDDDEVDSEKQLEQAIVEAPNDYEGTTANIVHHDYQ